MARLDAFEPMLSEETSRQNLISKGSQQTVWHRHIADSAQLVDYVPRETVDWLDLGSGAGFPGIVVSILRPQWKVTLVEARGLRAAWLERLVRELALENCTVAGLRLENMSASPASVISARAFAPLEKLIAMARRFSTVDTIWLLPKGRSAAQEVQMLAPRDRQWFHVEQSKTDPEAGIVVGTGIGTKA
jgi:16S rRNA (guanine527-N7)-methyltransferase